jgi:uncharacterized protein YkwD
MKYLFLSTFCILSTILGVSATAMADVSITMPIEPTDRSNSVPESNKSTQPIVASKLELEIYDRINKYRQSQSLPPLAFDPIVAEQARAHSQNMARQSILSHDGFHERFESVSEALPVQSVAENVATNRGYSQPELIAVQSWLESPGHHHNIIGRYNATGIGVIQNARGEYYFTQIFVRKIQ